MGNTRNDYCHEWIAISSHKGNFSQMMDSLWLWANIINWGANLLGRLHLIGEKKYWRALIHLTATTLSSILVFTVIYERVMR